VVPDAEARVGLDVVPGQLAEARPPVEETGPVSDDRGHRVTAVGRRRCQRALEPGECIGGLGIEHGLGQPVR
jgi:hypothetical protein